MTHDAQQTIPSCGKLKVRRELCTADTASSQTHVSLRVGTAQCNACRGLEDRGDAFGKNPSIAGRQVTEKFPNPESQFNGVRRPREIGEGDYGRK